MAGASSQQKKALLELTRSGTLFTREAGGAVRCHACGHRCFIPKGADGVCKVRTNVDGDLRVPWGYVAGLALDPVEKKPFFHAFPGEKALSFGMLGCDYRCGYCQNWFTSQVLRDSEASGQAEPIKVDDIVKMAKAYQAKVVTSTYNEPLITSEWSVEIFRSTKEAGLVNSFVSNGNATKEVLDFIRPFVDLYKVDLKSFQDKRYRELGGVLKVVLESIERIHSMGFWLEIVSLIVPGFNDSDEELRNMASFVAGVSREIPWHVTAYHEDYKMQGNGRTHVETLVRAAEIGKSEGLHYVYAGNLPGQLGTWENTYCPKCAKLLIERRGFRVLQNHLLDSRCPDCQHKISGVWK